MNKTNVKKNRQNIQDKIISNDKVTTISEFQNKRSAFIIENTCRGCDNKKAYETVSSCR